MGRRRTLAARGRGRRGQRCDRAVVLLAAFYIGIGRA
jgi:hypothetical protein